jgi:hypothetical protein
MMTAEGRWLDSVERLGEGPMVKGCYFVGFRDKDRLYVELREAGPEWVVDTIEIHNMQEMQEYIDLEDA